MKTNTWEVLNLQIRTLIKLTPHSQNHHIGRIIVALFVLAAFIVQQFPRQQITPLNKCIHFTNNRTNAQFVELK